MKLTTMAAALAVGFTFANAAASQEVQSLRGDLLIDEVNEAGDIARQNTSGRFERAYRQQPPLIPHRIAGYKIDLKVNKCLSCHDWPNNVEQGAPKVSETHYVSREVSPSTTSRAPAGSAISATCPRRMRPNWSATLSVAPRTELGVHDDQTGVALVLEPEQPLGAGLASGRR